MLLRPCSQRVSVHPPCHVAVGDDPRARQSFRRRLAVDGGNTSGVIDMAVGVDDRMDRAVVPGSDECEDLLRGCLIGRVDQNKPVGRADSSHAAAEVGRVHRDDIVGDRGDGALRYRCRPFLHLRGAVPQPLEQAMLAHMIPPPTVSDPLHRCPETEIRTEAIVVSTASPSSRGTGGDVRCGTHSSRLSGSSTMRLNSRSHLAPRAPSTTR